MTTKERARLKSMAHDIDSIIQIGKNGVTQETIKIVSDAFNNRELIKIKIQDACSMDKKDVANNLAEVTKSQVVQIIGSKVILYKKREEKKLKKFRILKKKTKIFKNLDQKPKIYKFNQKNFYKDKK